MIKMNEILMEPCFGLNLSTRKEFEGKIGRICTQKDWIHWGSNKMRFEYCLDSRKELVCISSDSKEHTGGVTIKTGVDELCINSEELERIYLHRGSAYNQHSFMRTGLVAGGKESKEGRHAVFFTPLDPFGSDAHAEEGPSEDYSKPRSPLSQSIGEMTRMPCAG